MLSGYPSVFTAFLDIVDFKPIMSFLSSHFYIL